MTIQKFEVGPFLENTYLLTAEGKAVLIDPGFSSDSEFQKFEQALQQQNAELIAVLLTHAHVDHVLGLPRVLDRFDDIEVYLNHSDLNLWERFPEQSKMFGIQTDGFDFVPAPMDEQEGFEIGPFKMDVLYTPGHAPDHVSLYFKDEKILIAGDTLFQNSIGRTDLYKGSFDVLKNSIQTKLYSLPNETKVYPGHGPETTIGNEKKTNAFVKG